MTVSQEPFDKRAFRLGTFLGGLTEKGGGGIVSDDTGVSQSVNTKCLETEGTKPERPPCPSVPAL